MSNTTPEGRPGFARRAFLTTLASAIPAATIAPADAITASAPIGALDVLYEERTFLVAQSRELHAKIEAVAPALQDQLDTLGERIETLDRMLESIPIVEGEIAQKAAALLLVGSVSDRAPDDMFSYTATSVLEVLLPRLRGQIREHAKFVLNDSLALTKEMPFWSVA